ncbi:prepilin-type N-terminal cleavage/methylation domain-containing protein [bacterium]|nr:MAG: prepilin-type N-terminal cleavage/methylation domain-containing protein [bacterium]
MGTTQRARMAAATRSSITATPRRVREDRRSIREVSGDPRSFGRERAPAHGRRRARPCQIGPKRRNTVGMRGFSTGKGRQRVSIGARRAENPHRKMSNLHQRLRRFKAFTLVELLIVIVILAVLAAIVIPKFADSSLRSKESSLKANLKQVRNAVELFKTDTGAYPGAMADLAATAAPTAGKDAAAAAKTIAVGDFRGPYLSSIPNDPVSGTAMTYSTTSGTVGQVKSSATGTATDGTTYASW